MRYFINPSAFSSAFAVPSAVVDNYIKLSSAVQLKVLLSVLRNNSGEINAEDIADKLSLSKEEVQDALIFWKECEILLCDGASYEKETKKTVLKSQKPDRDDVAKRGNEDPKVMMLLREAQMKFGRNLKTNEASTLVWLYDDEGMDVSVILLLLQYAVNQNKCNISFIEKTAAKWLDNGVENLADAESQIEKSTKQELAFKLVSGVFGLEKRRPSDKELTLCDKWVNEYGFSDKLLKTAYDACVDQSAKFSFAYISKIIDNWHQKGVKTVEDAQNLTLKHKTETKNDYAAFDLDAYERKLNSD